MARPCCTYALFGVLHIEFGEQFEPFFGGYAEITNVPSERIVVRHEEVGIDGVECGEDEVIFEVVVDALVGEGAEHLCVTDGCDKGFFENVAHATPRNLARGSGDIGRNVLSGTSGVEFHEARQLIREILKRERWNIERDVLAFVGPRYKRAHCMVMRAARKEVVEPDVGIDENLDGEAGAFMRGLHHASPHFSSCSAAASSRSSS